MNVAAGAFIVLVGGVFTIWGAYRLSRPRREEDDEWSDDPISSFMRGAWPLNAERSGAIFSVVAGVTGILLGVGVMLA